jgi:hypothetical protein
MTPLPPGASLADFIADRTRSGKRVFTTSRSAAVTHQRCPRRRYLGYHYEGTGITKVKLAAPLATGGYTHDGLAMLLKGSSAVDAAGAVCERYREDCQLRGLDLESTEDQSLVAAEQVALVEAFVHLAARRAIPQLLQEYELVDVEREEWFVLYEDGGTVVVMEARCDGLLRERTMITPVTGATYVVVPDPEPSVVGDLYVLSWKTAASWDRRKAKEAKTDMQGLSEAYAVELRVGELVVGTKMIHLIKGKRKEYPDDSGKYIQSSPLVHAWMNGAGPTPQFAWAFNWKDETEVNDWGKPVGHRLGKGWRHCFIPDVMPVAEWVQMLDEGMVQPEAGDCLERQLISPMPEPRSPKQKQAWLRQIETQELAIADNLKVLEGTDADDVELLLDAFFPQYTHSCNYPSHCSFWELCHTSEDVDNPITLYQIRQPHHPGEQMVVGAED